MLSPITSPCCFPFESTSNANERPSLVLNDNGLNHCSLWTDWQQCSFPLAPALHAHIVRQDRFSKYLGKNPIGYQTRSSQSLSDRKQCEKWESFRFEAVIKTGQNWEISFSMDPRLVSHVMPVSFQSFDIWNCDPCLLKLHPHLLSLQLCVVNLRLVSNFPLTKLRTEEDEVQFSKLACLVQRPNWYLSESYNARFFPPGLSSVIGQLVTAN